MTTCTDIGDGDGEHWTGGAVTTAKLQPPFWPFSGNSSFQDRGTSSHVNVVPTGALVLTPQGPIPTKENAALGHPND